jgi:hypothetical protein
VINFGLTLVAQGKFALQIDDNWADPLRSSPLSKCLLPLFFKGGFL